MKHPPRTVDEYLSGLKPDQRAVLEKLRKTIRAAAPGAEEVVSYGIAAFRLKRMLVGFGASAKHCSFYLMSTTAMKAHRDLLEGYGTGKGTVHFQPEKPLPAALVRKLVKARIAENTALDKNAGSRIRPR